MSNLFNFRLKCDLRDLAHQKNSKSPKFHEFGSLSGIFKTCVFCKIDRDSENRYFRHLSMKLCAFCEQLMNAYITLTP